MGIRLLDFKTKEPSEKLPCEFNFSGYENFQGSNPEVIASVVFKIYLATDLTQTDLPAMQFATSFTNDRAIVWVQAGTDGLEYRVRCLATTALGSVYEEQGKLTVQEIQ